MRARPDESLRDGRGVRRSVLAHAEEVEGRAALVVLERGVGPGLKKHRDQLNAGACVDRRVQGSFTVAIACKRFTKDKVNT